MPCAKGLLGDVSQNCRGVCHLVVPEEDGDTTPINQTFKGPDSDRIFDMFPIGTRTSIGPTWYRSNGYSKVPKCLRCDHIVDNPITLPE